MIRVEQSRNATEVLKDLLNTTASGIFTAAYEVGKAIFGLFSPTESASQRAMESYCPGNTAGASLEDRVTKILSRF